MLRDENRDVDRTAKYFIYRLSLLRLTVQDTLPVVVECMFAQATFGGNGPHISTGLCFVKQN